MFCLTKFLRNPFREYEVETELNGKICEAIEVLRKLDLNKKSKVCLKFKITLES